MGDVDELNATIGLALTKLSPMTMGMQLLRDVQHRLFDIGAELSMPGSVIITEEDLKCLEQCCETINETLLPLKNFVIPGGTQAAARLHFARTVCRRAERSLWALDENPDGPVVLPGGWPPNSDVNPITPRYLNRLSDFLFIMSRQENRENSTLWNQRHPEI